MLHHCWCEFSSLSKCTCVSNSPPSTTIIFRRTTFCSGYFIGSLRGFRPTHYWILPPYLQQLITFVPRITFRTTLWSFLEVSIGVGNALTWLFLVSCYKLTRCFPWTLKGGFLVNSWTLWKRKPCNDMPLPHAQLPPHRLCPSTFNTSPANSWNVGVTSKPRKPTQVYLA